MLKNNIVIKKPGYQETTERLTFYLTKEVAQIIRKESKLDNRSMSKFIEVLVRRSYQ